MTVRMKDVGEKELLKKYVWPLCDTFSSRVRIGDDAAFIPNFAPCGLVVSTDKIPEDLLAVRYEIMTSWEHGRYLAQVNISDVASMGAKPLALVASLAFPKDYEVEEFVKFMEGLASGCRESGTKFIGGDLGSGSVPYFSGTAFGEVEEGACLTRTDARCGNEIFVSGSVGGFGAALAYFGVAKPAGLILSEDKEAILRGRLCQPRARWELGLALGSLDGVTACMDVTDGLRQSVDELANASGVGFVLDFESIPLEEGVRDVAELIGIGVEELAFGIGLDLELLGTCERGVNLPAGTTKIGCVEECQHGLMYSGGVVERFPGEGWQHFVHSADSMIKRLYGKKIL